MKRHLIVGVVAGVSLIGLAGCSDDEDPVAEVAEANTQFCQDLSAFGSAVDDLAALDPATATTEDYSTAADAVGDARSTLAESAQELSDAEWDNLEAQAETLQAELQDAPDDVSVQSILDAAQAQARTVAASVAATNTAICTPDNVTTTTAG